MVPYKKCVNRKTAGVQSFFFSDRHHREKTVPLQSLIYTLWYHLVPKYVKEVCKTYFANTLNSPVLTTWTLTRSLTRTLRRTHGTTRYDTGGRRII